MRMGIYEGCPRARYMRGALRARYMRGARVRGTLGAFSSV